MANCPRCGTAAASPVRTWGVYSQRAVGSSCQPRLTGIFECRSCKARFRATVLTNVHVEPEESANIKNAVERIKGIKGELMQTLKVLRERIKTLETERANLMVEISELRKIAESRAYALEGEVSMLREEARSLRELLGYQEGQEN